MAIPAILASGLARTGHEGDPLERVRSTWSLARFSSFYQSRRWLRERIRRRETSVVASADTSRCCSSSQRCGYMRYSRDWQSSSRSLGNQQAGHSTALLRILGGGAVIRGLDQGIDPELHQYNDKSTTI